MTVIHAPKPLFAWDCVEDSPSLQTIQDLLAALPDGKLLNDVHTLLSGAGIKPLIPMLKRRGIRGLKPRSSISLCEQPWFMRQRPWSTA